MKRGPRPTPAIERLLRRVDKTGNCWLWTGGTNGRGYGVIGADAPARRLVYVHRLMWQSVNGAIPDGLEVCHTCDVRNCVNPNHLFLGTHSENVRDQVEKGRNRKGVAMYWSAKVGPDQVREIRQRVASGERRAALASEYGLSASSIDNIVNGKRWAHVD